ncbi:hypothetical protein H5P28_07125 [Ruficoccus amylovorans]|uniref:Uncharacterized protein n=1 Tax=Ruficoccus amylovorans TaxID=1804625 RepID=A0A842HFF4_9BACT|nr:hypothetical protein [Ruficoccus amylovorans]MBC2594031.1 hypothetical protein [Ruficoccus amylovorans]
MKHLVIREENIEVQHSGESVKDGRKYAASIMVTIAASGFDSQLSFMAPATLEALKLMGIETPGSKARHKVKEAIWVIAPGFGQKNFAKIRAESLQKFDAKPYAENPLAAA